MAGNNKNKQNKQIKIFLFFIDMYTIYNKNMLDSESFFSV